MIIDLEKQVAIKQEELKPTKCAEPQDFFDNFVERYLERESDIQKLWTEDVSTPQEGEIDDAKIDPISVCLVDRFDEQQHRGYLKQHNDEWGALTITDDLVITPWCLGEETKVTSKRKLGSHWLPFEPMKERLPSSNCLVEMERDENNNIKTQMTDPDTGFTYITSQPILRTVEPTKLVTQRKDYRPKRCETPSKPSVINGKRQSITGPHPQHGAGGINFWRNNSTE